jgi:2-polyprenyl-6-methoxyphenol hydroxylase-like FAD-dependent oxidoreductase
MSGKAPRVVIIGAGTGGLCLAQGLKRSGIAVDVFERDHSPQDRQPGYRLSISATGSRAMKECLPGGLFRKLMEISAQPSEAVTFLDHQLHRLLAIDLPQKDRSAIEAERPINRTALRAILLEGLGEIVKFGKKFVAFETMPGGAIAAHFEDGSTASAGLLVGADGANSRVRSQLLPEAKRAETGLWAIAGKLPLSEEVRASTPAAILRGPTPVLGPRGCFLFCSAMQYGDLPARRNAASDENNGSAKSENRLPGDREEYVMWGFSARRERFPFKRLEAHGGEQLKEAVAHLMKDWHPSLRSLVQRTSPSTVHAFSVKTSVPIGPWHTSNVTLLGDALHNMTPFRGAGANSALWDAAALRRALVAAGRGEEELLPALAQYERGMIEHGFGAVRTSLGDMARFHAEGLNRVLTKVFFRAVDWLPGLKPILLAGR